MRARGINYDTGFLPGQAFSRPDFNPADVRRDMDTMARKLHCDAGAVYDEGEQVRYFTELSELFERIGIDTALWLRRL